MPSFSHTSTEKLKTCHPDLQAIFMEVIKFVDCVILEGHRNQDDQQKAFFTFKSKLQWPNSKHNSTPSMAVDVAPFPLNWKNIRGFFFFAGFVMAIAETLKSDGVIKSSIRYGGDWDRDYVVEDQMFNDLVHFEIVSGE